MIVITFHFPVILKERERERTILANKLKTLEALEVLQPNDS